MVLKNNKKSMREIVRTTGIPTSLRNLRAAYKLGVDEKRVKLLEQEIADLTVFGKLDLEELKQIICRYDDVFDKDVYVLHMGRLLEYDNQALQRSMFLKDKSTVRLFTYIGKIESNENRAGKIKTHLSATRNLLRGSDVIDLSSIPNPNSPNNVIGMTTTLEFLEDENEIQARKLNAENKLEEINRLLGLGRVLSFLVPTDLIRVCRYQNLGNLLARNLKENPELEGDQETDYNTKQFERVVKEHFEYMDIDNLLVLSVARYYSRFEDEDFKFDKKQAEDLQEYIRLIESILDKKNTKINSPEFEDNMDFQWIKLATEELHKHFIAGKFYSLDELKRIKIEMMEGTFPLDEISKIEFGYLQFSSEEISCLVKNNQAALSFLQQHNLIDATFATTILENVACFENAQLAEFVNSRLITRKQFFELYMQGKITLDNVKYVKLNCDASKNANLGIVSENESNDSLPEMISQEYLIELYFDSEKQEEFDKYKNLYKLLVIDETVGEEMLSRRLKIEQEFLDKIPAEYVDENLIFDLYYKGLISFETVCEYETINQDNVVELYVSGKLKPQDAKRLYAQQKYLTKDVLLSIFKDEKIDKMRKLMLLGSTFSDSQKDVDIINEILDQMEECDTDEPLNDTKKEEKKRNPRYPFARWELIEKLDKEYSQTLLPDETIIFYLPNKGEYIIEKLFNKDNSVAIGVATYILKEDVYNKYKNDLFKKNGTIQRTSLVRLYKDLDKQGIEKIVHTGWGKAILKYYNIEKSEEYTEEEKQQLRELAAQVE